MIKSHHCVLCDNQGFDVVIGATCALTGKKPEFARTCPKIILSEKFEEKLKEVNIEFEKVKN